MEKAGILECAEKIEEIDCIIDKEVTKYKHALDEQLKLIIEKNFLNNFYIQV